MNVETRRDFLVVTGCTLGAFAAFGCRAGGTDASPSSSGSDPSVGADAGKPSPTPSRSSSAVRPFRFDVGSFGGRVMGEDAGQPVHEWASWLRVRSAEHRGDLVLSRHSGDMVERAVGWFRSAVDDDALAKLQDAITSTRWSELPAPQTGDPTANTIRLSYTDGELSVEREFSVTASAFIAAITPVMGQIQASMSSPLSTPHAAVAVTAEVGSAAAGHLLRMRVRNVGSEPVVVTDPRVASDAGPRAQLMVAAAPGPMGMPAWTSVPLPALPRGAPEVRVLGAGEALVVEATWRPTLHGACLLQAIWSDYAGPVRAAPEQLAWLPVPAEGPIPTAGPYPVRGAAFSSYAAFDA